MEVVGNEIRSLAEQGPSEEELDKAKKYLIGSYALRFDTSTKIAGQLVHLQTDGYGVDYLDERNKLIAAVSMEDAQRAAKRLLDAGELLVVVTSAPHKMMKHPKHMMKHHKMKHHMMKHHMMKHHMMKHHKAMPKTPAPQ